MNTEPTYLRNRWMKGRYEHTVPRIRNHCLCSLFEVEQAVGMLKCGKAPGLDGVPMELIQHSGPASIQVLLKLCIQIWCSCSWPDAWKRQEIVMIHKSGNTKECTNYRTIALLRHASKVFLIILLKRVRENIEYELPDEQAGFRRGRSTADMLVALQVLIEKTLEIDGQAFVVFIDYSKAFDSISQVQMFEILSEMGSPKHLVALLEALYNDQSAVIRWNGRHSSAFKIERGVRQGCILSPHLFNLYTESVIREAGIEEMGIKIGGKLVSNLRYADDTALCANSQEEAERLIGKVNIIGKSRLLKLNVKKTKLLKIGKMQCDAGVADHHSWWDRERRRITTKIWHIVGSIVPDILKVDTLLAVLYMTYL